MKTLTLISLLFSYNLYALTFEIKSLCEDSFVVKENIKIKKETTVGHLTIDILEKNQMIYTGNENGIGGLLNTPVGMEGYEVLADNHMRAYGWCFSVNGTQPSLLASEVQINIGSEDHIIWLYGYAELIDHDWISYCTPVYKKPTDFACKN